MRELVSFARIAGAIGAAVAILVATSAWAANADTDAELDRTWAAARVYVPDSGPAGVRTATVDALDAALAEAPEPPVAVVVYAHGCSGPSGITDSTGRFLARAGYVVVAPDSYARKDKPVSCDPATHRGGLHRAVLGWRHAEIRYAVDRIRDDPALGRLPIVLMGHSQGAIATATVKDIPVDARIVEGWTCHAGWPEYRGLNAPPGQPVLTLVGESDPWFTSPVLSGDCGAFMAAEGPSRSVVYRAPGYLARKHWLSGDRAVQREILEFLNGALTPKP